MNAATPEPQHDDADVNGAGTRNALQRRRRREVRPGDIPPASDGPPTYDYGVYTAPKTFTTSGPTTGSIFTAVTGGSATIDARPQPARPTACSSTTRGSTRTTESSEASRPTSTTRTGRHDADRRRPRRRLRRRLLRGRSGDHRRGAAEVTPSTLKGGLGKTVTVTGNVLPAREDVFVALTREAKLSAKFTYLHTDEDGAFAVTIPVDETTELRAIAESISSQTLTVTMNSTVKIAKQRLTRGRGRVRPGTVSPTLPGRLLLLPSNAFKPTQTKQISARGRSRSCSSGPSRAATRSCSSPATTVRSARRRTRCASGRGRRDRFRPPPARAAPAHGVARRGRAHVGGNVRVSLLRVRACRGGRARRARGDDGPLRLRLLRAVPLLEPDPARSRALGPKPSGAERAAGGADLPVAVRRARTARLPHAPRRLATDRDGARTDLARASHRSGAPGSGRALPSSSRERSCAPPTGSARRLGPDAAAVPERSLASSSLGPSSPTGPVLALIPGTGSARAPPLGC